MMTVTAEISFQGEILGLKGTADISGRIIGMSPDGVTGTTRGHMTITGTSGELVGLRGTLTFYSDSAEGETFSWYGHVNFGP